MSKNALLKVLRHYALVDIPTKLITRKDGIAEHYHVRGKDDHGEIYHATAEDLADHVVVNMSPAARDSWAYMLGNLPDKVDVIKAVGAMPGSTVNLSSTTQDFVGIGSAPGPTIDVYHPLITGRQERYLYESEDGETVCKNAYFELENAAPKGYGIRILARQVAGLHELGVRGIRTHAARSDGGSAKPMIGYYVWPRAGYEAPVPEVERNHMQDELSRNFEYMSEVMDSPQARAWWFKYGDDLKEATFDLRSGSHNERLMQYLLETHNARLLPEEVMAQIGEMTKQRVRRYGDFNSAPAYRPEPIEYTPSEWLNSHLRMRFGYHQYDGHAFKPGDVQSLVNEMRFEREDASGQSIYVDRDNVYDHLMDLARENRDTYLEENPPEDDEDDVEVGKKED